MCGRMEEYILGRKMPWRIMSEEDPKKRWIWILGDDEKYKEPCGMWKI
jgi:hypothetical protein